MVVIKFVAFVLLIMASSVSGRNLFFLLSALGRRAPPTSTPENQTIIASAKVGHKDIFKTSKFMYQEN